MRSADSIARDILILKLGDKNNADTEQAKLVKTINGLDTDILSGLLKSPEGFIAGVKEHVFGAEISKSMHTMLNAVFKTIHEPKSVSMLGKLLFAEKAADLDYALALLLRLLERVGLTVKVIPMGYSELKGGIAGNKLLECTDPIRTSAIQGLTQQDFMRALFIMNDEPDNDISCVKECAALLEYKRVIAEASGMKHLSIAKIPDYTTYPNMVLVMGLCVIAHLGKTVELRKETLEQLVMSIINKQAIDALVISA